MSANDGTVQDLAVILDNGTGRFTVVIVGDGFQQGQELQQFSEAAGNLVSGLLSEPAFTSLNSAFTIYRLDVASMDSGPSNTGACGSAAVQSRTYFDSSFCTGSPPIERALYCNTQLVRDTVTASVPDWHMIFTIVNSSEWGGSADIGGGVAIVSLNDMYISMALHEMGHAAFGLADEYEYWAGCGVDPPGTRDHHPNVEPQQPNVTTNATALKWNSLLPNPASVAGVFPNPDCTQCLPATNPQLGTTWPDIGAFEGAHYYHCGAYRPQFDCRMRNLPAGFCRVCSAEITQTLTPFAGPST
jgi:hypothetical protein